MVGIIDPLRPEAAGAVHTALRAGIDVRMITGDHAVTAQAIGHDLGLGPGAISGRELQAMSDEELTRRLPQLHVFGRVSPEDKLRLARTMQQQGLIVAMTGDAVNDAAALKQADIGVAMGSGSEVTKQAARMILTDDNFGTLVHAVEIGRRVYEKIVAYVRYQMTQLLALVMLFVVATAFNINQGVALTPSMVLYLFFFATALGVIIIAIDPGDPEVMHRRPRDPGIPIINPRAVLFWLLYAVVLFGSALVPLVAGPDQPRTDAPSAALTMTFAVMGLGTVGNAIVNRRDPASGLLPPILKAAAVGLIPVALIILATRVDFLQKSLLTQALTGAQWLACLGLASRAAGGRRGRQVDPPEARTTTDRRDGTRGWHRSAPAPAPPLSNTPPGKPAGRTPMAKHKHDHRDGGGLQTATRLATETRQRLEGRADEAEGV
jgi:Ca2+-transporting ATPase